MLPAESENDALTDVCTSVLGKRFLFGFYYVRKVANKAKSTQQDQFNFYG